METKNFSFKILSKLCICTIIALVIMILSKAYPSFKDSVYKNVFEKIFRLQLLMKLINNGLDLHFHLKTYFQKILKQYLIIKSNIKKLTNIKMVLSSLLTIII